MRSATRGLATIFVGLSTLCAMLALGTPALAAGARAAQLPHSDYTTRGVCPAPTPGRVGCLALTLEPLTTAARSRARRFASARGVRTGVESATECTFSYGASCFTPEELRDAYFPGEEPDAPASTPQTIALVDAYDDLDAEANLSTYSAEFGLPACTSANGCFKQVNEDGSETPSERPFPKTSSELQTYSKGTAKQQALAEEAEGWALETATDVEMAHAICHNCHIVLVEAGSPGFIQLDTAENSAAALGATEISNSWGGEEEGSDNPAFNHPGIVVTASAGDDGYLNWDQYATREQSGSPYFEGADYPASSPHVVSVGGTSLSLNAQGVWQGETTWNGEGAGGGGCSSSLHAPEWQLHVSDWASLGCGENRASTDVSADADPSTGVNVYDTMPYPVGKKTTTVLDWVPIGGTSVASPIIASMFALAGGAQGVEYPAQILYSHLGSPLLHDVTTGGNGECNDEYLSCSGSMVSPLDCGAGTWICNATTGYDGPTGVGTPNGIGALRVAEGPVEEGTKGKPGEEKPKTGSGEKESKTEGPKEEKPKPEGGESKNGGEEESTVGGKEGPHGGEKTNPGQPVGGGGSGSAPGGGTQSTTGGSTTITSEEPTGHTATPAPALSALTLTPNAHAALNQRRLELAQVAFSFKLTRTATVHVALELWVAHSARHHRWYTLPASLTLTSANGVHRRHLHGTRQLSPGVYRIVLSVQGGGSRSITFRVR